jgi:hypothetical protein
MDMTDSKKFQEGGKPQNHKSKGQKVKALKGIKPEKPKSYVHLFCKNEDDFKEFCGGETFTLDRGKFKGRVASVDKEENVTFLYCWKEQQIQGLTKINYHITDKFKSYMGKEKLKRVSREIAICNFESNQYLDPEHIPKVLREKLN